MTDKIELMCQKYWDSFRNGFISVGGEREYPTWKNSSDPVKDETRRCMRHAVEALKADWGKPFEDVFPDKPMRRKEVPVTSRDNPIAHLARRRGR